MVSVWECEKPSKKKQYFQVQFRPYPHYIVFDFEALLKALNECQTSHLTYTSSQKPISMAIHDSLMDEPSFIVNENPKLLIRQFVAGLELRQELIVEDVENSYLKLDGFDMLPDRS